MPYDKDKNAAAQARWREKRNALAKRAEELEAENARLKAQFAEGGGRRARVEPETLSMSAQQKLDAAIRQEKRKLQAEFEKAVSEELRRALNETVLPQFNKEREEFRWVLKSRKGVMTRATYRMILSWLHPDRITDPGQKEGITKAFIAFTKLELVLCNEKEMPTTPTNPFPRTYEEMMKRKAEVKARRARQKNGVQVRS